MPTSSKEAFPQQPQPRLDDLAAIDPYSDELSPESIAAMLDQDQKRWADQKQETAWLTRQAQRLIAAGDTDRKKRPINQDKLWSEYRKEREGSDFCELLRELDRWIDYKLPIKFEAESRTDYDLRSECLVYAHESFIKLRPQLLAVNYPTPSPLKWSYTPEIRRVVRDVFVVSNGRSTSLDPSRVERGFGSFVCDQCIRILTD